MNLQNKTGQTSTENPNYDTNEQKKPERNTTPLEMSSFCSSTVEM